MTWLVLSPCVCVCVCVCVCLVLVGLVSWAGASGFERRRPGDAARRADGQTGRRAETQTQAGRRGAAAAHGANGLDWTGLAWQRAAQERTRAQTDRPTRRLTGIVDEAGGHRRGIIRFDPTQLLPLPRYHQVPRTTSAAENAPQHRTPASSLSLHLFGPFRRLAFIPIEATPSSSRLPLPNLLELPLEQNALAMAALTNGSVPARKQQMGGFVGFANLPNQWHRRSVRKGFNFTAMVVGQYTAATMSVSAVMPRMVT